jgi:hypothetical protein
LYEGDSALDSDGTPVDASTQYVIPDDSYAGLTTTPGDYGGSWTGEWPIGSSTTPEYDFWSPKLLNWSSTAWSPASANFVDNCNIVLRRGLSHAQAAKGKKGQIDMICMDRDMFADFKDNNATNERLNVARGESPDGLYALGFRDVVNFDGVDVTQEFSIPANTVYGINTNTVEVALLNKNRQLFGVKGPEYDIKTLSWLVAIVCFGQMKWNPRAIFKAKNYDA